MAGMYYVDAESMLWSGNTPQGTRLIPSAHTEEPRRSGRATKGQHKNLDPADEATPTKRGRGKKHSPVEESTGGDDEGDAIIRCVCGMVEEDEDDDRKMICCDKCAAWQHNECMEVSENDDELPDQYFCELCRPDLHKELLIKIRQGEKPWEEREKQREREAEEKKSRRRKGGKKGKKGRASEVKSEVSEDMNGGGTPSKASPEEPAGRGSGKRKLNDGGEVSQAS